MLQLHQRWLQRLDGEQDLSSELLAAHDFQGSLQDVVAELVVDKLLDDEVDSLLEVLGLLALEAELLYDLVIIIWEGTSEDLVDMWLGLRSILLSIAHLGVEALLNDIA